MINLLGISYSRLFYTFLLLDIIERSIILQTVTYAIKINLQTLGMTGYLGLIIMFIYVFK